MAFVSNHLINFSCYIPVSFGKQKGPQTVDLCCTLIGSLLCDRLNESVTFKKLPKALFSNTDFTFGRSSFLLHLHKLKSKMITLTPSDNPPDTTQPLWLQSPSIKIATFHCLSDYFWMKSELDLRSFHFLIKILYTHHVSPI